MYMFLIFILPFCGLTHSNILDTATSWVNTATGTISDYYCTSYECCDEKHVPYDLRGLKIILHARLYGQHIAERIVLDAITSHLRKSKSRKPLVMTFHGSNGVGKTYVSRIIAKAFYEKGESSRYFHFYYGLDNFPLSEKISEYQMSLKYDIETAISKCEKSLFVFDGVDYMPPGLLNVLMPFIDCPNCNNNPNKNKSIFIFLTNTGSLAIQKQLMKKMEEGVRREDTTIQDFDGIIDETFRGNGGLFESLMITSDAIDFYVPFLPLEKKHVVHCVKEAFHELKTKPTKDLIDEVLQELRFGPEAEKLFSNSGCKRVYQIVGRIVTRFDPDFDDFDIALSSKNEL